MLSETALFGKALESCSAEGDGGEGTYRGRHSLLVLFSGREMSSTRAFELLAITRFLVTCREEAGCQVLHLEVERVKSVCAVRTSPSSLRLIFTSPHNFFSSVFNFIGGKSGSYALQRYLFLAICRQNSSNISRREVLGLQLGICQKYGFNRRMLPTMPRNTSIEMFGCIQDVSAVLHGCTSGI